MVLVTRTVPRFQVYVAFLALHPTETPDIPGRRRQNLSAEVATSSDVRL